MSASRLAIAVALVCAAAAARAQVTVEEAWVRGTVTGQTTTGAYMRLKSVDGGALIGAQSPIARAAEFHITSNIGGVMRMRAVPQLVLPAGRTLELKPGGYHLMLTGLKQPLRAGETVPITLRLEAKDRTVQEIEVRAEVREVAATDGRAER